MKENNNLLIAVIVLLVLLILSSGFVMMGFDAGGMMNMMMGRGYGMMGSYPIAYYGRINSIGLLFNILFFLIIIILTILPVVWLVKKIQK